MQVFAPAGQCYNALNFVISAYKDYQSIFETLNKLFAQCIEFLGRLPNYVKGKMSRGMSQVSCDVMRLFVNVCDKALSLQRNPMFKLKTIAKITFLSVNDFSSFLDEMNELTEKQKLEALSGIYLNSAVAAENSTLTRGILEDDRAERTEEKKEKKDRRILLQNLDFDKSQETWDGNAETPIATWSTTYHRICQKNITGTGKWLLKHPKFQEWKKKDGKTPILAIVGPEASGKSNLAAAIIGHLQREGTGEPTKSRHLTAFYFLDKSKANSNINVLGKSIIWQFAESDASYMQSAALTCERNGRVEPKYFLTQLLLENEKEMEHIDATFYVVINKFGDSEGYVHPGVLDFLQRIDKRSSVRILLTTTEKTIDYMKQQGVSYSTVSMKENKEDLRLYIDARMDRIDVLSDRKDSHVLEIRKRVQDSLQEQANGNFYLIDNILDQISVLDLENEIYEVLEGPVRTLSQHIADDVRNLSSTRTPKELKEINEIILWITFAQEKMTVEKMKAVLQFHNGAASLRPLEERLKKFLLFEIDNEGNVDFRSHTILREIPERAHTEEQLRASDQIVNKGEVDILNHFLGNVCPPALIDKLDLAKHFENKLGPQRERIFKEDSNTAHFKLAKICLHALTSPAGDNLRVLRGYAVRQMVFHMSRVELSPIDRGLRSQMGPHLVRLFREGSAIDNLFWANKEIPGVPPWILEQSTVDVISRWLRDTAIVANVSEDTQTWIQDLLGDEKDTLRKLNEPSAIRMAYWCCRRTLSPDSTLSTYRIVGMFLSKVCCSGAIVLIVRSSAHNIQ
jgi:energy-coupling factor transporter ATP-binding protein EcfA2